MLSGKSRFSFCVFKNECDVQRIPRIVKQKPMEITMRGWNIYRVFRTNTGVTSAGYAED